MSDLSSKVAYDIDHAVGDKTTSRRVYFRDQEQASQAAHKLANALMDIVQIDTLYGSCVVKTDISFVGMFPRDSNPPVEQVTFRASDAPPSPLDESLINRPRGDEVLTQGKYQPKHDLSGAVLVQLHPGDDLTETP